MKVILQDNRRFILRMDKGEEVLASLLDFAAKNNITAATFSGLGACTTVELGFYNEYLKDYRRKPFPTNMEILSLNGNISMSDGQPTVHAHGSFSDSDFNMVGGHVFKLEVSATCEIFLIKLDGQMERKLDEPTNLNLLS